MGRDEEMWQPVLDELERRKAFAHSMGGAEKVARQREKGKLDARQRAAALFDEGTFVEIGALAAALTQGSGAPAPADGLIAGYGMIEGRPALAGIEDFTVLGGSIGTASSDKRYRLAQLARQERVPLVFMLEGAGHRLTDEAGGLPPNDLQALAELSGHVPMLCLVLGASAGHGALTAPLSDFVIMTEAASLFAAGPPLVKAAIGETVTKEELGGPQIHVTQSGVAHNLAADDEAAIALARRYLSYFPSNAWDKPPSGQGPDSGPRRLDAILDLINPDPRYPFSMQGVLGLTVDSGSLLEVQPQYGRSIVTALARLGGQSVAIVANDPSVGAGAIDTAAALKAAHFMEVAGAFHLPVIFLADNPGVMAGSAAERAGILRASARMFAAQHRLKSPKVHVTLRKAFGFGSSVMAMNPWDCQTSVMAFPAIALGAMPARSGGAAAGMSEEERAKATEREAGSAYHLASRVAYDDVIDPRDLRNVLLKALALSVHRPVDGPVSSSGILP